MVSDYKSLKWTHQSDLNGEDTAEKSFDERTEGSLLFQTDF